MKTAIFAICAFSTLLAAANAADHWVQGTEKSFSAQSVRVDGITGTLDVKVAPGPAKVRISGDGKRVMRVRISKDKGQLIISDSGHRSGRNGWDWVMSLFSGKKHSQVESLQIHIVMPEKSPLKVESFIGNAKVVSTHGPVDFEAAGFGKVTIGDVSKADLHLAGSGIMTVGRVAGPLTVEVAGSGKLTTGDAQSLHSEIAGSGDVRVGNIAGDLSSDIAGTGDLKVASVHGGVKLNIAGSGNVKIAGGAADPFDVDIMGSGDVRFDGVAHNPKVDAMGSGKVWVKAVTGQAAANTHLIIGSRGAH